MPDASDINVQDACRKLNANLLSITEVINRPNHIN